MECINHDSKVLTITQQNSQRFPKNHNGKFFLLIGYTSKKDYLASYREIKENYLGKFYDGPPRKNKHKLFNRWSASICSDTEWTFGM